MRISYPAELPVSERRAEIAAAIRDHQVVIVAGETGSGKTTQLPKICLELGRGSEGLIGHTQPRRIAARSVAERIAAELGGELGGLVGYQVRFADRTSPASRIKLMTDGILLAELQRDRELRRYDTLIIDEAHERSLNIDFILGYLKRLLPRRRDLKVVITSATIDVERFSRHFDGAPVIEVTGRTYPVEVRYRPLARTPENDEDGEVLILDQTEAIGEAVRELRAETPGDILVFLPGEREIRDTADALAGIADGPRGFEVVALYSRLSAAEQHRVFERHSRRRVVLATNVAETSLTVPGITAVIDTGVARISRYSTRTKVQRLPIEPISQASANQRAGRCGRVAPGVAIRLYDEEDFEARPAFTEPEILRTSLASVILQMAALGLGDIERFGFVEPPDARNVRAGVAQLRELGALKGDGDSGGSAAGRIRLTAVGRKLARLPIDPQLGRMMLAADRAGCLREVIVIAAALSIQDPRERPVEHRARADGLHARFADKTSDFLTWLNLWDYLREQQRDRGSSAFRRMCREEHLNYLRVREWQDFESQLRQVAKQVGMRVARRPEGSGSQVRDGKRGDLIHQALLTGLLSHIGLREVEESGGRRRDYLGARGTRFAIFPGSALARSQPPFVVAAELVETSRLWGRQCAAVDPLWVERAAEHLVKRGLAEPHWSRKRAAAMARERVTLYGVPLVADRLVSLAGRDAPLARELFIRHALVQGDWHSRHEFLRANRELLAEAEEWEHRARRRDLVVDEETLFDFYDRALPAEVVSGAHFDAWWKGERRHRPDALTFDPAMLLNANAEEVDAAAYPDQWRQGALDLRLSYRFDPGSEADGVRIDIPLAALAGLGPDGFSWQVPGLRRELVIALLRSLPKSLRVQVVPAPNVAAEFLAAAAPGEEPLPRALARHLRATRGVHVPETAWDWSKVPAHLMPTYRILDGDGATLGEGKDLEALAAPLRPQLEREVAEAAASTGMSATGERRWAFGEIPATFSQHRAGHEVVGYPGLLDEGEAVGLRVFGNAAERDAQHLRGITRLLALRLDLAAAGRQLAEGLDNTAKLELGAAPYPSTRALLEDCALAALAGLAEPVWTEAEWEALSARAARDLSGRATEARELARRALGGFREADRELSGSVELARLAAMTDMREHLARLVAPGFVSAAGLTALAEYPRYLAAVVQRRRNLEEAPARDAEAMARVAPFQDAWSDRMAALPPGSPPPAALDRLRWLIEEFRVSLWAQRLGTREPVSEKRLRRAIDELDRPESG